MLVYTMDTSFFPFFFVSDSEADQTLVLKLQYLF